MVWVEDEETRAYLTEAWGPTPIVGLLVAGGGGALRAAVEDARKRRYSNVLGIADRDYGATNCIRWATARVLRTESHEVENHLLDAAALASSSMNTSARTVADIEAKMVAYARNCRWWVACSDVLATLRKTATDGFPGQLSPSRIDSETSARDHILESPWTLRVSNDLNQSLSPARVTQDLRMAHQRAAQQIFDGSWRTHFPGKQIFRDAVSWMWTQNNPGKSASQIDVARAVARHQRTTGTVPVEVLDLLGAIVSRT